MLLELPVDIALCALGEQQAFERLRAGLCALYLSSQRSTLHLRGLCAVHPGILIGAVRARDLECALGGRGSLPLLGGV